MFEQLETADDNLVALWQQQGQQEAAIKAELEQKEKERLAEIERRENALKQQESELAAKLARLAELEAAEAARNGGGYQPTDPNISSIQPSDSGTATPGNAPTAPLWGGEAPQAPAIQFGGFPEQATPPSFPPQQPAFQIPAPVVEYESTEQDYINTISFNQGIDAVINHFMSTPNKYEKQAWVNLWNELKK
jgi:phage-related minor tail protein